MSRSAADATRFTATSPHAYSKPSPTRSAPTYGTPSKKSIPRPQKPPPPGMNPNVPPPPPNETPQEKVARLRAQRIAARDAQLSTWERIVVRGRVWADRAHKFTALTLIGLTGKYFLLPLQRLCPYPSPAIPTYTKKDSRKKPLPKLTVLLPHKSYAAA